LFVYGRTENDPDFEELGLYTEPVDQYSVAVKVTFVLAKALLIAWLKLNEKLFAPAATDTDDSPGVLLTPPAVFTHVTPQVTSKVSDGLIDDEPTILTRTFTLVDSGFATVAVQL